MGLSSSATPELEKIQADAKRAKPHFSDVQILVFVTSGKVTNYTQEKWQAEIKKEYGWDLGGRERNCSIGTNEVVDRHYPIAQRKDSGRNPEDDEQSGIANCSAPRERRDAEAVKTGIGILALKHARGQIDADAVRREGERLLRDLKNALDTSRNEIHSNLTTALKEYFDPTDGRFQERVERLIRQDGESNHPEGEKQLFEIKSD